MDKKRSSFSAFFRFRLFNSYNIKSQVSIELFFIIIALLLLFMIVVAYSLPYSKKYINLYEILTAKNSMRLLANEIEFVYHSSYGTNYKYALTLPPNVLCNINNIGIACTLISRETERELTFSIPFQAVVDFNDGNPLSLGKVNQSICKIFNINRTAYNVKVNVEDC